MEVGRLGPWKPQTVEERLHRMESFAEIRQLAMRYGLYLDARDMDSLMSLFAPDVRVGRDETGRDALRRWYVDAMSKPRTSIHMVLNHIIDFQDADHATGVVYCRDELEQPATGEWHYGTIQYWDQYERMDGEWYFRRRRFHRWYIVDALTRPTHGAGVSSEGTLTSHQLPEAWPTWDAFWAEVPS